MYAGLDRAVFFTASARLFQVLGSIGTVLLVIRYLSTVEQGYYYALLSLTALQVVFELGLSFVILQLAAHEAALLSFHPDGRIDGDHRALARLASVLQLTLRWYRRAALAMVLILVPTGICFFSGGTRVSSSTFWIAPWATAVAGVSATFVLTPLLSFLEGCKQVKEVAGLRMQQSLVVLIMSWGAIVSGHGLYACAAVNIGWSVTAIRFLSQRRAFLSLLFHFQTGDNAISWRREIWPFQWKTGISWLCSYFTLQLFTPILFFFRGPAEAGRMGLSISMVGYLPVVALCWISTKAAPFGQLISLGRIDELNQLFFAALKKAITLVAFLAVLLFAAVLGVHAFIPAITQRMESPTICLLLTLTAISSFVTQGLALYLRSFKSEPYLAQSIAVAALTLIGTLYACPRWGSTAVAFIYFITTGVVGLGWSLVIFIERMRKQGSTDEVKQGIGLPERRVLLGSRQILVYELVEAKTHEQNR